MCFFLLLLQIQDNPRAFKDVDVDTDDHGNYTVEPHTDTLRSIPLNWKLSEQYVDMSMKSAAAAAAAAADGDELMTNTIVPSSIDDEVTTMNATDEINDDATTVDTMAYNLKNDTCVGEPEYCNYTELEYRQMVYDYIFPTPGEWVLVACHAVVFLVGLVSFAGYRCDHSPNFIASNRKSTRFVLCFSHRSIHTKCYTQFRFSHSQFYGVTNNPA